MSCTSCTEMTGSSSACGFPWFCRQTSHPHPVVITGTKSGYECACEILKCEDTVCTCVYICTICIYTHTHAHTHTHIYTYIHIHIYTYTYIHIYIYIDTYYIILYTYIYIYINKYISRTRIFIYARFTTSWNSMKFIGLPAGGGGGGGGGSSATGGNSLSWLRGRNPISVKSRKTW